ncbi:MAG: hypothetical protein ACRYFX_29815 [Janthinobacterium lividum]
MRQIAFTVPDKHYDTFLKVIKSLSYVVKIEEVPVTKPKVAASKAPKK